MAIFRKLHVTFWSDSFTSELSNDKKLFYIYLLTNERTTQCGIYEITKRQIAFDFGCSIDTVSKLLEYFIKQDKIMYNYDTNEIAIKNWGKYNISASPKVQSCVNKELTKIKDTVLIQYVSGMYTQTQEEQEEEKEEEQQQDKKTCFSFDEFWELYNKKVGKEKASNKYAKISQADRLQIKNTLPNYLAKITDKKYQKDPLTYLNGKHWQDEYEIETQKESEQETMPAIITRTSGGGVSIDFSNYGRPIRK